jgi:hypothetical protein
MPLYNYYFIHWLRRLKASTFAKNGLKRLFININALIPLAFPCQGIKPLLAQRPHLLILKSRTFQPDIA